MSKSKDATAEMIMSNLGSSPQKTQKNSNPKRREDENEEDSKIDNIESQNPVRSKDKNISVSEDRNTGVAESKDSSISKLSGRRGAPEARPEDPRRSIASSPARAGSQDQSALPFPLELPWTGEKQNITFLGDAGTKDALDMAQLNLRRMTGEKLQGCDLAEAAILLALEELKEKGRESEFFQAVLNLRSRKTQGS